MEVKSLWLMTKCFLRVVSYVTPNGFMELRSTPVTKPKWWWIHLSLVQKSQRWTGKLTNIFYWSFFASSVYVYLRRHTQIFGRKIMVGKTSHILNSEFQMVHRHILNLYPSWTLSLLGFCFWWILSQLVY